MAVNETTLDDDIALVRRMLGEGWELERAELGGVMVVERSEPDRKWLDFQSVGWRALVDLARKLEAAQQLDDAQERSAAVRPRLTTVYIPDPSAAVLLERVADHLALRGRGTQVGIAVSMVHDAIRAALAGRAP